MSVEVSCPGCGSRLRAPDNSAGKRVKCKKCGTGFHIPGGPADALGESQMLSAIGPGLPAEGEVPMAAAVEDEAPAPLPPPRAATKPPARPAADVASLPSADPFDFSAPPAKPAPVQPKPAAPPPTRPAFGSAGKLPAVSPSPPPPPKPAPAPARPAAKSPPPPLPAPAEPEVLSLDDDEPPPPPKKPAAPASPPPAPAAPAAASPFAFDTSSPAEDEPRQKRRDPDDDDSDDEPRARKRRDRDAEDDRPRPRRKDADRAPPPTAAASDNPFGFVDPAGISEPELPRGRDRDEDYDEDGRDEGDEDSRPRYLRAKEQKRGNPMLVAGILGALALAAAIAAVIVAVRQNREPEATPKSTEKTDEPPVEAPPVEPPKNEPPKDDGKDASKVEPKVSPKAEPKANPKVEPKGKPKVDPKTPEPKGKSKVEPKAAGPGGGGAVAMMNLPAAVRTPQFREPAAKPEPVQKAGRSVAVEAPFDKVRRVFPPTGRNGDTVVVWEAGPGLAADLYSSTGARVGRADFAGDAAAPVCDFSPDGKHFAAAGPDGKVSVWNLIDKAKTLDGFDPYPDAPAGPPKPVPAAVFFTAVPGQLVTVSTAGAVHLFDTAGKTSLGTFVPPNGAPGRVALGKSVAADEARTTAVVAAGGVVYQIELRPGLPVVWQRDLGDVGRAFGIAVAGKPGRLAYAFETDTKGKKDRAVLFALPDEAKGVTLFRWPDKAGEPAGAMWAGPEYCVIPATGGKAVWAECEENRRVTPLALLEPAGGKALHAAADGAHWYLLPSGDASVLVELTLPPEGLIDLRDAAQDKQPLYTLTLDEKGMSK